MNNEPVAWMFEKDGAYMCIKHDNKVNYDGGIPLYTHPAKTLTDTEIVRISETCDLNHVLGLIDFARAILRKASEK
jgi:hypothetical protein